MTTITAAAPKIKLQRGMAGWYVYYANDCRDSFDIFKIGPGMWTVKHGRRENGVRTVEAWTVESLDAARALIAATI